MVSDRLAPPPSPPQPSPPQPPPSGADSPDVLARFRSQLDLVDLNARQLARRMAGTTIGLDDLTSFGREGLLRAARTYDEAHGVPFRRWANLRIRGAMVDGVRKWGALPRRIYRDLRAIESADSLQEVYDGEDAASPAPSPEAADTRLSSYLAGLATAIATGQILASNEAGEAPAPEPSPEEAVARAELVARAKAAIERLAETERKLVELHYFGDQTIDEAAASLGLSKSWGSRLHARAIEALARELRREYERRT
jgi:RNA polymerase sigma factor for flagellar operon FliA